MASQRRFYRTVLRVEVLSDRRVSFGDLKEVAWAITAGDCSGEWRTAVKNERVDGPTMAKPLAAQGSDPFFFGLDEDGNDAA